MSNRAARPVLALLTAGVAAFGLASCSATTDGVPSAGSFGGATTPSIGGATESRGGFTTTACGAGRGEAAAAATIHCQLQALGRGDYDADCSYLSRRAQADVARKVGLPGSDSCADAQRRVFSQVSPTELAKLAKIDSYVTVTSVDIHGTDADVHVSIDKGARHAVQTFGLVFEDGAWRVDSSRGMS